MTAPAVAATVQTTMEAVGVTDGLNPCLGCKFGLKTEANTWAGLDWTWEREMGHDVPFLLPQWNWTMDKHSGYRKISYF